MRWRRGPPFGWKVLSEIPICLVAVVAPGDAVVAARAGLVADRATDDAATLVDRKPADLKTEYNAWKDVTL